MFHQAWSCRSGGSSLRKLWRTTWNQQQRNRVHLYRWTLPSIMTRSLINAGALISAEACPDGSPLPGGTEVRRSGAAILQRAPDQASQGCVGQAEPCLSSYFSSSSMITRLRIARVAATLHRFRSCSCCHSWRAQGLGHLLRFSQYTLTASKPLALWIVDSLT